MKRISIALTILVTMAATTLTSFTRVPETEEPTGIVFFEGNWEQALAKAAQENKIIFLDAYASWCGPCKVLKARVFPDEQLGLFYNANFINVKMDMEKGEGPQLARKYGITAYPTLFYLKGDGSVVKKVVGYHDQNQLIAIGEDLMGITDTQ
jgi:thioredoxin 1